MPTVQIEEAGCRDCGLCVEICPTKVFEEEAARTGQGRARGGLHRLHLVRVSVPVALPDRDRRKLQRPFHRMESNRLGVALPAADPATLS
jgi:ferredoxin